MASWDMKIHLNHQTITTFHSEEISYSFSNRLGGVFIFFIWLIFSFGKLTRLTKSKIEKKLKYAFFFCTQRFQNLIISYSKANTCSGQV